MESSVNAVIDGTIRSNMKKLYRHLDEPSFRGFILLMKGVKVFPKIISVSDLYSLVKGHITSKHRQEDMSTFDQMLADDPIVTARHADLSQHMSFQDFMTLLLQVSCSVWTQDPPRRAFLNLVVYAEPALKTLYGVHLRRKVIHS